MPATAKVAKKERKRSGTNTRQKQAQVGVRLLPEEHAQAVARAERDSVSVAELARRALLRELLSA